MHLVPLPLDRCPDCGEEPVAFVHVQAPLFWFLGEGGPVRVTRLCCRCGWDLLLSHETVRPTDDEIALAKEAL